MPEAPMPEAPMPEAPMPEAPMPEAPMPEAPMPEAPIILCNFNKLIRREDFLIFPIPYKVFLV